MNTNSTKKNKNLFFKGLLAALIFLSATAMAQNPLSPALNFNVFLQKGATLINNETEGPIAMGGDLTLSQNSYQVSTNYTGTFTVSGVKVTLVVGGKVNYNGGNGLTIDQNGYVKIGDCGSSKTWYTDQNRSNSPIRITPGTDYNGSPRINLQASAQQLGVSAVNNPVCQGGLIDFDAAFTTMKASSASISLCTDNTNLTNSNGSPIAHTGLPNQVKLNLAAGINTLNLNGSDMNNVQDFIYNNHPDATHVLIINVNAPGTFNWSVYNSGGIGFGECPYILYNFYNTTTLNIVGNGAVEGTVFAPYADIVKTSNQANIEGQVIAQSYIHNGGENHYPPFNANVAGCGNSCTISVSGTKQNISCHDANNGSINVTASGNNGAVTYLWNDGVKTEDRTGLSGGTYSVTATDAGKCSVTSETFTITNPSAITASPAVADATTVGGTEGSIALTVSGGTSSYSYKWNDGPTTKDRTALAAGDYTITITDGNSCNYTATYTVHPPTCTIGVSGNKINISCHDSNNGAINITASGNNGAVSYLWNDGVKTEDRTGLTAGSYSVTVTDAAKCSVSSESFTIVNPTAVAVDGIVTDVTMKNGSDGSIDVTATGGTNSYTYLWADGSTDEDRNNLPAGTYTVTVKDANNCSAFKQFTVMAPVNQPPVANDNNGTTNQNTAVTLNITDNDSDSDGTIDPSTVDLDPSTPGQQTAVVTTEGTWTVNANGDVTFTPANGFTGTATLPYTVNDNDGQVSNIAIITIVINPNPCDNFSISVTSKDPTCHGGANGSVSVVASGGSGYYGYLWNTGVSSKNVGRLTPGTYRVVVTDKLYGCKDTAKLCLVNPKAIAIKVCIKQNASQKCNGKVTLTASNGTAPYTYKWNDGFNQDVRENVCAGIYSVIAKDAKGCTSTVQFTVGATCNLYLGNFVQRPAKCSNPCSGYFSIKPTGGPAPYKVEWDDNFEGATRSDLCVGQHTGTVTDARGCSANFTVNIGKDCDVCGNTNTTNFSTIIVNGSEVSNNAVAGSQENNVIIYQDGSLDLSVKPNPARDFINVILSSSRMINGKINIVDINGKLVKTKAISLLQGNNDVRVDLTGLAQGRYELQVVSGDAVQTTSFMIVK